MSNLLTTDDFWLLYLKRQRTKEEHAKLWQFINNGWGCSYGFGIARITHYVSVGNEHAINPAPDISDDEYQKHISSIKRNIYYNNYYDTQGEKHPCHNRVFDDEVGDIDVYLDNDNYINDVYGTDDIDVDDDDGVYEKLDLKDNFDPYGDGRIRDPPNRTEYLCDYLQRTLNHTGIQPEFCIPLSYYLCDLDYRVIKGVPFNRQSCNDEHIIFPYNISKITHMWKGKSPLTKYGNYSRKWLLLGELTSGYTIDNKIKYFYLWSRCSGDKFGLTDYVILHICNNYNMLINGAVKTCDRRRLGIPSPSSSHPSSSLFNHNHHEQEDKTN